MKLGSGLKGSMVHGFSVVISFNVGVFTHLHVERSTFEKFFILCGSASLREISDGNLLFDLLPLYRGKATLVRKTVNRSIQDLASSWGIPNFPRRYLKERIFIPRSSVALDLDPPAISRALSRYSFSISSKILSR